MKINEMIRERHIAKKLTQEQMAGYLGVTAPAVINGKNFILQRMEKKDLLPCPILWHIHSKQV